MATPGCAYRPWRCKCRPGGRLSCTGLDRNRDVRDMREAVVLARGCICGGALVLLLKARLLLIAFVHPHGLVEQRADIDGTQHLPPTRCIDHEQEGGDCGGVGTHTHLGRAKTPRLRKGGSRAEAGVVA